MSEGSCFYLKVGLNLPLLEALNFYGIFFGNFFWALLKKSSTKSFFFFFFFLALLKKTFTKFFWALLNFFFGALINGGPRQRPKSPSLWAGHTQFTKDSPRYQINFPTQ
jgi:hypothetical protein